MLCTGVLLCYKRLPAWLMSASAGFKERLERVIVHLKEGRAT